MTCLMFTLLFSETGWVLNRLGVGEKQPALVSPAFVAVIVRKEFW